MAKNYADLRLEDILPDSISSIKEVQDAALAIDHELQSAAICINEALLISRIDYLPESVLDLLAWQYHVDIYEPLSLPIEQKRKQVKNAILLHRHKGTPWAIKQALNNLGYDQVRIIEWWDMSTDPHTFGVKLYPFSENKMRDAERIITEYKPIRSHLVWLEGMLSMSEVVEAEETIHIGHLHLLEEVYPWPDTVYGGDLIYSEILFQRYGGSHKYGDTQFIYGGDLTDEVKYGGSYRFGDIGLTYGLNNPGVPKYGVFEHAEKLTLELRNFITELVFAPHVYGEQDLLYNGSIEYDAGAAAEALHVVFDRELLYNGTVNYGEDYQGTEVNYI